LHTPSTVDGVQCVEQKGARRSCSFRGHRRRGGRERRNVLYDDWGAEKGKEGQKFKNLSSFFATVSVDGL
jgi:hypothetical protein